MRAGPRAALWMCLYVCVRAYKCVYILDSCMRACLLLHWSPPYSMYIAPFTILLYFVDNVDIMPSYLVYPVAPSVTINLCHSTVSFTLWL